MTTNYDNRVPLMLREEVERKFQSALDEGLVIPQAENFIKSLVMEAYCYVPDVTLSRETAVKALRALPKEGTLVLRTEIEEALRGH